VDILPDDVKKEVLNSATEKLQEFVKSKEVKNRGKKEV